MSSRIERRFADNPDLALAECWYWIRKLQARFFAGDYAARPRGLIEGATAAVDIAVNLRNGGVSLLRCALLKPHPAIAQPPDERQQHVEALAAHHRQLEIWAAALPGELREPRRAGRRGDRPDRRPRARCRCASTNRPSARPAPTALSTTRRSPMSWRRAFTRRAASSKSRTLYLRNARDCYLRWGADGKVRQLDALYPRLRTEEPAPAPTSTIGAPVEHLDLATVIKVSQAVSGEIVLEKLLDTLMRTAHRAGGRRTRPADSARGAEQRIAAEATTSGDTVDRASARRGRDRGSAAGVGSPLCPAHPGERDSRRCFGSQSVFCRSLHR